MTDMTTADGGGHRCTARCNGACDSCNCHKPTSRAALLLNLGTPDSPSVRDVRCYLREFLSDPFVMDFPKRWDWIRPPLAQLIAHFRGPRSAEAYRTIWTDEGSPLKIITQRQAELLQQQLPNGWRTYYAMRYANPSIREVLGRIAEDGVTDLVVVPMYPQWSGSTTGTALQELYRQMSRLGLRLNVTVRGEWYDDVNYIEAQARLIYRFAQQRGLTPENAFLLHSTHSLPTVYVERGDPYEGHVRRTCELVNRQLGWPRERTAISFQSKLGPVRWLEPSTEDMVRELAEQGVEHLLVCPISFTADCLETLEEIGMEYRELFAERSRVGGQLHLIPALNDEPEFIQGLTHLVRRGTHRVQGNAIDGPALFDKGSDASVDELIASLVVVGVSREPVLDGPGELIAGCVSGDEFRVIKRPQHDTQEVLRAALGVDGVRECWLLNTCHRYELFALLRQGGEQERSVIASPLMKHVAGEIDPQQATVLYGRDAWWHLLRTTAGLNSPLPGDADVVEQLESARRLAEHAGSADAGSQLIIEAAQKAVEVASKRSAWDQFTTDYCKAALEPIIAGLGLDTGRIVVIGGSGTSTSLLRMLVHDCDVDQQRVTVVYRGKGRKRLVNTLQSIVPRGQHVCVEDYGEPGVLRAIGSADVVFLGIDRKEPILHRGEVEGLRDFSAQPLRVVDFNTHGSTVGLDGVEGVHITGAGMLEQHVRKHVEMILTSGAFATARRAVEAALRDFVDDPERGAGNAAPGRPGESEAAAEHGSLALPVVDHHAFEKYAGLSVPRHVAYPMPSWWHGMGEQDAAVMRSGNVNDAQRRDLSLYLHLPFCEKMCKFCACNRTILRKDGAASEARLQQYLAALHEEVRRRGRDMGDDRSRVVRQIHWGGGTPTYLTPQQMIDLHEVARDAFCIASDAEVSIEIDPRVTTREHLEVLRELGFNRVSLGVQDFDPVVQEHVNRVQPYELVQKTVQDCREVGFASINFDLIYGLPYQTPQSVADAVTRTIELGADRVAFYHYAQIPDRIANQRKLHHEAMPDSDTKLAMLLEAVERFQGAGYLFVGLDHFAKPDEALGRALRDGTINRNFQGMTTGAELDLVGMGCSAISCFPGSAYVQNVHEPTAYAEAIEAGGDPVIRGMSLSRDDAIRQRVLLRLYCDGSIDAAKISEQCGIDFGEYFADELERLQLLADDGLVELESDGSVRLTYPLGRVLMRNVAAVFDKYLDVNAFREGQARAFSTSA